jgi:DNA-binding XRE family transcriptional regulator
MESSAALVELRIACGRSPTRLARALKVSLREYRRWERDGVPASLKLAHLVAVARHLGRADLATVFERQIHSYAGPNILVQGTRIVAHKPKPAESAETVAAAA